jgi:hypothetical protein
MLRVTALLVVALAAAPTGRPLPICEAKLRTSGQPGLRPAVAAVMDASGRAHVFVDLSRTRRLGKAHVRHFIAERDELWDAGPLPAFGKKPQRGLLDAALDAAGRVHVLLFGTHLVRDRTGWREGPAPWPASGRLSSELGRGGSRADLVPAGPELYCVFRASGKSVGARFRVGVVGGAGYGGAGVLPWPDRPDKLVVVRRDSERWGAAAPVDLGIKEGAQGFAAGGDDTGRLWIVYRRGRVAGSRHALASLAPSVLGPAREEPVLTGRAIRLPRIDFHGQGASFAVEPQSGKALLVHAELSGVRGGSLREVPFEEGVPGASRAIGVERTRHVLLEPGDGELHLLALERSATGLKMVTHRTWREGAWTRTVALGTGDQLMALATGEDGVAFAVWRQGKALFGRWIRSE